MTDEQTPAPEAGDVVVQSEATEQAPAAEAPESTKGQEQSQPAEDSTSEDEISKSKARRERRKAAAERTQQELEALRKQLAESDAEIERMKGSVERPAPRQEDFDNYDDYVAERAAWAARRGMAEDSVARLEREKEDRTKRVEEAQTRSAEAARENWAAQVEEGKTRYADFEEVVLKPQSIGMTREMQAVAMASDRGADIVYHIATNPDVAAHLVQMQKRHPALMAGAMQMLERVLPNAHPQPKTQTTAPDPVTPVKAKSGGQKPAKDMSMAEYRAARAAGKL